MTIKQEEKFYKFISFLFLIIFAIQPILKLQIIAYPELRISAYIKLALVVGLLFYSYYFKIKKDILVYISILISCFLIGQLILSQLVSIDSFNLKKEFLIGDIYIVAKYLFIFLLVGVFENLKNKSKIANNLIKIFTNFMFINIFFVIIGLIFSINYFKTYPNSLRFGYQGLLLLAGESLYFYIFAISIAYIEFIKTKKFFKIIIFILGALLLGKKAIFLFLVLLFLIHLWNIKYFRILYITIFILLIAIIFNKLLIEVYIKLFPFWDNLYNEHGQITLLLSKRDLLFCNVIDYIRNSWINLNYLFGGVNFNNFRSELGFFDLFLTFGILGLITYLIFLKKYFFNMQIRVIQLIILAILVTDFFSGGLLINITPMIVFYILVLFSKYNFTSV